MSPVRLAIAAASCLAACSGGTSASPPTTASAADAAAPAPPAARDAVYVSLDGKEGVTVIDRGELRRIVEGAYAGAVTPRAAGGIWLTVGNGVAYYDGELHTLEGAPEGVQPVVEAPSGTLWATAIGRLARFDGSTWKEIPLAGLIDPATPRVGPQATAAPDGTVYVTAVGRLLVGKGDDWRAIESPLAGALGDVVVDRDGRVLATVNGSLLRLDGEQLVVAARSKASMIHDLHVAPSGDVYAFAAADVYRLDGGRLVPIGPLHGHEHPALAPDGSIYAVTSKTGLVRWRPDGEPEQVLARGALPFDAQDLTVDGGGRVWIKMLYGIGVLEGTALTVLTPGTVPELPANAHRIVAIGDGASLPPAGPPKLIRLTGSLVAGGKPKAGVKVELCPSRAGVFYGRSPCEGQSFVRRATTGKDGTFALDEIPLGGWHIVYKVSRDRWVFYWPAGCCGGVAPGGTFDMGAIEFGRSSK